MNDQSEPPPPRERPETTATAHAPQEAPTVWWTLAQACVWIRTLDQYKAEGWLGPRETKALVLADGVVPGAAVARHSLRMALANGRIQARGRAAKREMTTDSGELQDWILEETAEAIPRDFWQLGGDFALGLGGDGATVDGDNAERWARVEFDRDRIVAHWPRPLSVLEDGPVPLSYLIECGALHAGETAQWAWFLGRDDVTVSGLNAAEHCERIAARRLEMAPIEIEGDCLRQGAVSWSFVMVCLTPPALPNVTRAPPPVPTLRGYFGPITSLTPTPKPEPEGAPPDDAKAQTATSLVDENVIAAWARPGSKPCSNGRTAPRVDRLHRRNEGARLLREIYGDQLPPNIPAPTVQRAIAARGLHLELNTVRRLMGRKK